VFRRSRLLAVPMLAFTLLCATPAASQTASPEATAAARELLESLGMTDQYQTIVPSVLKQLLAAIAQSRPDVERELNALMPLMLEFAEERRAVLIETTAAIYIRRFTVEEMRQLTAFYRQPVGQKLLENLPAINKEQFQVGQQFGHFVAAELKERIIEELRKRGHKI
jgi:uncharacterized protein